MVLVVMLVVATAAPGVAGTRAQRFRAKLYGFVNDYRADHGRVKLRDDRALSKLAWRHSLRMAKQRRLFHTADLNVKLRSWKVTVWGENIGAGPSIWGVFKMWTKSDAHRRNLLDTRFRRSGVGIVHTRGGYWITMIYYG